MSTFKFDLHPLAAEELTALSRSPEPGERRAAARLLTVLELARTHPAIRERLLTTCQTITVSNGAGSTQQVAIKLIKSLVEIANDARFQTDAVRRIRDLTNKPADKYRVFFAQRPSRNGVFVFQILGVFHRDKAYSVDTLSELKRRYESRA